MGNIDNEQLVTLIPTNKWEHICCYPLQYRFKL